MDNSQTTAALCVAAIKKEAARSFAAYLKERGRIVYDVFHNPDLAVTNRDIDDALDEWEKEV
jgi:hypothetical protein